MNAGDGRRTSSEVCFLADRHAPEFLDYLGKPKEVIGIPEPKWEPPADGFLKTNTDGAFSEVTHSGGWGSVVLGPGSAADAFQAEAEACSHAINFAAEARMGRIVLETDAANLKIALQGSLRV